MRCLVAHGRRVSSYAEIARLPTEAIERTEILPEEVALKYGYPADRKEVSPEPTGWISKNDSNVEKI